MSMRMRARARLALPAILAAALLSGGCAGILRSYDIAPSGLRADEDRLRRLLAAGQAGNAFDRLTREAPDDEMLHALYHGVLAYYAGDYAESARVLDIAAHIADERMTKSISRSAFSLVSNDLVLPYEPSRTERLMIPYYAALARLRGGDVDGAAVEARRLSLLLQRYDDDRRQDDASLRATMRYLAGAIFDAAGDHGDADVAYRNAFAIDSTLRAPHDDSRPGHGSVVIVLEQGFVAHRAEQALAVMLLPEEVHAIAHGSGEDRASVSAFVAGRIIEHSAFASGFDGHRTAALHVPAPDRSVVPRTRRRTVCTGAVADRGSAADSARLPAQVTHVSDTSHECVEKDERIDELPYLLKIAWPVYRSPGRPAAALAEVDSQSVRFASTADISRGVLADFDAERALIVARTIARGTAKLAITKGAERKLEETNEAAGRLIGLLGNIGNVLTERADTRSWHLLPTAVSIARLQLPAGEYDIPIRVAGAAGTRPLSTGPLTVRAGSVVIVPVRSW